MTQDELYTLFRYARDKCSVTSHVKAEITAGQNAYEICLWKFGNSKADRKNNNYLYLLYEHLASARLPSIILDFDELYDELNTNQGEVDLKEHSR